MLTYPLGVYRGDTYRWQFVLWADPARTTAVDLTGVIVAAEIRVKTGTTPIYPLACTVTKPRCKFTPSACTPRRLVSTAFSGTGAW